MRGVDAHGYLSLRGSSFETALSRPALAPWDSSSLNRIVPLLDPPVFVILS
jgi:hypothetical protein